MFNFHDFQPHFPSLRSGKTAAENRGNQTLFSDHVNSYYALSGDPNEMVLDEKKVRKRPALG